MSRKRLARVVGVCAAGIIIIAGVILLPVGCGEPPPDPPSHGMQFDGSEGCFVHCGDADALNPGTGEFTIAAWIKTDSGGAIFSVHSAYTRYLIISVHEADGFVRLATRNDVTASVIEDTVSLQDGAWHHVAATKSSDKLRLYVDGVLVKEAIRDSLDIGDTVAHCYVGRWRETDMNYRGVLSEVRFYHRALSAEEIRDVYMHQAITDDLVAYWKLDEGSGLTARDSSGHNNHGVLEGDPQWIGGGV